MGQLRRNNISYSEPVSSKLCEQVTANTNKQILAPNSEQQRGGIIAFCSNSVTCSQVQEDERKKGKNEKMKKRHQPIAGRKREAQGREPYLLCAVS